MDIEQFGRIQVLKEKSIIMCTHMSLLGCVCIWEWVFWPSLFPAFLSPQPMVYFHFVPKWSLVATAVVPVVRKQRSTGKNKGGGGLAKRVISFTWWARREGRETMTVKWTKDRHGDVDIVLLYYKPLIDPSTKHGICTEDSEHAGPFVRL